MKVVTRRTGLSAELLRVWERRYSVVSPGRTQTGRRLYSDAEIERLHLLYKATLGGRSIGLIASLPNAELADLIRQDAGTQPMAVQRDSAPNEHEGRPFVIECVRAVARFDPSALDDALRRAAIALSATSFLRTVVAPVLAQVGNRCRDGRLHAVHGHLTAAVVKRVLERTREIAAPTRSVPRLLVATLRGQLHELGAILGATAATADGWSVTWLGADLPAEDVAEAAKLLRVRAVALGLAHPVGDLLLHDELRRLRERLPRTVALITGNETTSDDATLPDEIGTFRLADFEAWIAQLRAVAGKAPRRKPGRPGA